MHLVTIIVTLAAMASPIAAQTRPKANEYKGNNWYAPTAPAPTPRPLLAILT